MTHRDLGIDIVPVVRAVGGERGDGTIDLLEQGADLRAVIRILVGQRRRNDPPGVAPLLRPALGSNQPIRATRSTNP